MTTDEKVDFANRLAVQLKSQWEALQRAEAQRRRRQIREDDLKFPRNEWQRWANYFGRVKNLNQAFQLLEHQGRSPALRSGPKEAAQVIREVLNRHRMERQQLSPEDLGEVFGYVSRWLEWLNFSGGRHEEGPSRHAGGSSGRRHRSR